MASAGEEGPEPSTRTAGEWLEEVLRNERRGEFLTAFDLAERGLGEYPSDVLLRYHTVLVLARAGSTLQAMQRFVEFDLEAVGSEDTAALGPDWPRTGHSCHRRGPGSPGSGGVRGLPSDQRPHPWLLSCHQRGHLDPGGGRPFGARALAEDTLRLVASSGDGSYYAAATEAEALLLMGDEVGSHSALERAGCCTATTSGPLLRPRSRRRAASRRARGPVRPDSVPHQQQCLGLGCRCVVAPITGGGDEPQRVLSQGPCSDRVFRHQGQRRPR